MTINMQAELKAMKDAAQNLSEIEGSTFEKRVMAYRKVGMPFVRMVQAAQKENGKATKHGVFTTNEKAIKKATGLSQTLIENECFYFASISEAKLKQAITAYLRKGCGDSSRDKAGNVKMQPRFLALGVAADLRAAESGKPSAWSRKTGDLEKSSGNALTPDKKAKLAAKIQKEIAPSEYTREWGLDQWTVEELDGLIEYLKKARRLAELTA